MLGVSSRPESPWLSRWLPPALIVFAVALAVWSVVGPSGWLEVRRLRDERLRLQEKISDIEAENARLRGRLQRLENDPAELERLAREKLGMVKPDEWVVVVPRDVAP